MAGGITFGAAKDSLRTVVDNGVGVTDPRVMRRTNEAIQELLTATDPRTGTMLIPVGCMIEVQVITNIAGQFMLPPEMENVVFAQIIADAPLVYGNTDVTGGWYQITNPTTYADPAAMHDNPLVDLGLVPDPVDPTILRRYMRYRGVVNIVTLLVRGKRRYQPIITDGQYLIVQNVPALKLTIQAIERRENLDIDNSEKYLARAIKMLSDEVINHIMDPMRIGHRKANYEDDLNKFKINTMGWMRARLALEVPGAINMGKEDLTRLMERAERRLMEMGIWKGCMEEFRALVVGGHIIMPLRVESILAASLCGTPIPAVRSILFKYVENGPGACVCNLQLEDEGEVILNDGHRRRKYRLSGISTEPVVVGQLTTEDTITAENYLYIGSHARLVATATGMRLEVKDSGGNWLPQSEWSEA